MTKKLYRVLVTYHTSGDMVIEADSADEAKELANRLSDAGIGEADMEQGGATEAEDVQEILTPDKADRENADRNNSALEELKEDEE